MWTIYSLVLSEIPSLHRLCIAGQAQNVGVNVWTILETFRKKRKYEDTKITVQKIEFPSFVIAEKILRRFGETPSNL